MRIPQVGPAGIPALGLGTFGTKGEEGRDLITAALAEGYRHLDTARMYENEADVGAGMKASDVPRNHIFLTTKIAPDDFAPAAFREALESSLVSLGTDYVDLLLLHWPSFEIPLADTLGELDKLIDEGKVRFGGVSNFTVDLLKEASQHLKSPLAANQVEFHPFIDQSTLMDYMTGKDLPFEAYCPLAKGKVMDDPVLKEIAEAHGVTPAAVSTAWIMSKPHGVAIPKTAKKERLASNLKAAEVKLSDDEIKRIDGLKAPGNRLIDPDSAPKWDD